jgi:Rps23 Pro-64 3,4-dihydroxylase Tpa1-like proline 4-hydroxylase
MIKNNFINQKTIINSLSKFGKSGPYDHCVIDNFFNKKIAIQLEREFPDFHSNIWHQYNNPIEVKKVCNNWNVFPSLTYQVFDYLNSEAFLRTLRSVIFKKKKLYSDVGLNGGGWHIHRQGGKLNTHLDYSLHPKLGLQRKLNIIIYLNSNWKKEWDGNLGLWSNESDKKPGKLIKEIEPKFNRAILFDTTQNSWHGLPKPLKCPKNEFRKSIAVYYLCDSPKNINKRGKALFAPTKNQINKQEVLDLIKKRSDIKTASSTYK